MNRRSLLINGLQATGAIALAASVPLLGQAHSDSESYIHSDKDWCESCAEVLARDCMRETGAWKETIRDRRDGRNPIVFTRHGCCGCEVTLQNGAHDPDWTFKTRALTVEERQSFRAEYGQQASLLLCVKLADTMTIRGYVLNGRIPGWNISTKQDSAV